MVDETKQRVILPLFLLPSLNSGSRNDDGMVGPMPTKCLSCTSVSCTTNNLPRGVISACGEAGFNFVRVHEDVLLRGFVCEGWTPPDHLGLATRRAFKNQLKDPTSNRVALSLAREYVRVVARYLDREEDLLRANALNERRISISEGTIETWARDAMQSNLSKMSSGIIHDIKQLLVRVSQNIDYVLTLRYGGSDKAVRREFPGVQGLSPRQETDAWQAEKSAFFSCEMLNTRINTASMVASIGQQRAVNTYSPHRTITKISRLYETGIDSKGLSFNLASFFYRCEAHIGMPDIVIQALIDNAIKYAPKNSALRVGARIERDRLVIWCESLGPEIPTGDYTKIFQAGYRSQCAQELSKDGEGLGLYQAKLAADGWADLRVAQDASQDVRHPGYFRTVFEIVHLLKYRSEGSKFP